MTCDTVKHHTTTPHTESYKMEQNNFNYSLKNIPIPNKQSYMKSIISKTESFIQRIRWKTLFYTQDKHDDPPKNNNYGFKTEKTAPQQKDLIPFENDLIELISNVEFSKEKTNFQKQLSKDVTSIKNSKQLYVPADKTNNIYKVEKETYKKLLRENITSHYEKAKPEAEDNINTQAKKVTEKLKIDKRVPVIAKKEAYVTLKDHKPNFANKPTCRLINPAKSEIGKISKQTLEQINKEIRDSKQLQQWRNTQTVIDWFNAITDKPNTQFLQLDIVDFYPSITEELFQEAILFASQTQYIDNNIMNILNNARQSLLFHDNNTWQKTTGPFDVTMGAFDGAEVCELVGLLILSKMKENFPTLNFGLYRDDGLAAHQKTPGPTLEKMKKDITKLFKQHKLKITIQTNMKQVDFLDVTLNLNNGEYSPYSKPNSKPTYIHIHSNHPPSIIKQIPKAVSKRLNNNSHNTNIFNTAKEPYEQALKESGYKENLTYSQEKPKPKTKNRKRNTIWFNPPYNQTVTTNIGKQFLSLLDKHFPPKHHLHPILNRKNVKVSYSCTANMQTIIQNHNKKTLSNKQEENIKTCNCRNKNNCPLQGKCLTQATIYKASITHNNNTVHYIGSTEKDFKTRYNGHTQSFRTEYKKNSTKLSQHIWNHNIDPTTIEWSITQHANPFRPGQKTCDICLSEKLQIINSTKNNNCLNFRNEVARLCPHKAKYMLCAHKKK